MMLVEIISIILCPSPTRSLLVYLRRLVADHHRLFKEVFSERNLVAKHHFLVHYASCKSQAGPACRYWSMRFEAKHKQLKDSATSFLNVCKTVALSHQRNQCIIWNTDKSDTNAYELDISDGETVTAESLQNVDEIMMKFQIDKYDDVFVCRKAVVNGLTYVCGDVVITGVDSNDLHQFLLIGNIVVYNGKVLLVGSGLKTVCFDNHFSSYFVEFGSNCDALFLHELLDPFPLNVIERFANGRLCVPLRHWVCPRLK
jgi:hypothetical protein